MGLSIATSNSRKDGIMYIYFHWHDGNVVTANLRCLSDKFGKKGTRDNGCNRWGSQKFWIFLVNMIVPLRGKEDRCEIFQKTCWEEADTTTTVHKYPQESCIHASTPSPTTTNHGKFQLINGSTPFCFFFSFFLGRGLKPSKQPGHHFG